MVQINRRKHERFSLLPAYSAVEVRVPGGRRLSGHAYDVGEGGVRFELDEALPPGTPVVVRLDLPGRSGGRVMATGRVVWTSDDPDEPGPVRMAADFARVAPLAALAERLSRAGLARAA
ncbi:MAG: PilZ domain-containing protein [Phycisphaerae bacterium]|nr:PilZ domain-containing protein [Phycisphaerae bacterium]